MDPLFDSKMFHVRFMRFMLFLNELLLMIVLTKILEKNNVLFVTAIGVFILWCHERQFEQLQRIAGIS